MKKHAELYKIAVKRAKEEGKYEGILNILNLNGFI